MSEMFGNKKPRIPVSKDDIKKAVLNANRKLKRQNEKLELNVKEAEKKLKETEEAEEILTKEVLTLKQSISIAQSNLEALNSNIRKEESSLSGAIASRIKQEELESEAEIAYDNLVKSHDKLAKAISVMEEKKSHSRSISLELTKIKKEHASMLDQIIKEDKNLSNLHSEIGKIEVKKLDIQTSFDMLKDELKGKEEVVEKQIYEINDKVNKAQDKLYEVNTFLNDATANKNDEIHILDSIITKKEGEYIKLEKKYKTLELKLKRTEKAIEDSVQSEKDKILFVRERFKDWKLTALEEVAKMKLKGKMETIDKAGLKDILGE